MCIWKEPHHFFQRQHDQNSSKNSNPYCKTNMSLLNIKLKPLTLYIWEKVPKLSLRLQKDIIKNRKHFNFGQENKHIWVNLKKVKFNYLTLSFLKEMRNNCQWSLCTSFHLKFLMGAYLITSCIPLTSSPNKIIMHAPCMKTGKWSKAKIIFK